MADFVSLNGYDVKDKKAVRFYDTVATMASDDTLKEGMYARTKGYYNVNDGGGADYIIVNSNTGGVWNEPISSNLYARILIKNDEINVLQIGFVKMDSTKATQNTTALNSVINKVRRTIIPEGSFYINDTISINTLNRNLVGTAINNCSLIYNGSANKSLITIGDPDVLISGVVIEKITFGTTNATGITDNINAIEFVGKSPTHNIIQECVFRNFKTGILAGRSGHVNNITIRDNNIYTCYNGIDIQYYNSYQVNAIYIYGNDIAFCTNCGIIMFGNSMIVQHNTIQACENYGISIGENVEHSFNQYCLASCIDSNYFEQNGNVGNDAVILLVSGTANSSTYYKSVTQLSITNNYFLESISKLNVVSTGHNGNARIFASNNYGFTIKNSGDLNPGSIIQSPSVQSNYPYTLEQNQTATLQDPNSYFYNIYNRNYFATNRGIGVEGDKQTTIIIYPTQASTTHITKDFQTALVKINLVGDLEANYYASDFKFESNSNGTNYPIGTSVYDTSRATNSPIISPLFYTFYTNKPTGASVGYLYVLKIQGNTKNSEFNVYIEMISNLLTARGFRVKITENEVPDIVDTIPSAAPAGDKDKLVYCTADDHWYGYYNSNWIQI